MSVAVALDELQRRVEEFGAVAFLVTTAEGVGAHVASVAVTFDGEAFTLPAGRTSLTNVDRSGSATLVWPGNGGPYCLIADGNAHPDGQSVVVRPTRAVLHRLAGTPTDLPSCVPIERVD